MANLSPEQAALLKKTYATAEALQASSNFKSMTPGAQKIALAAYAPVDVKPNTTVATPNVPTNADPMLLQQKLDAGGINNQPTDGASINGISNTNGTSVSQPETTVKPTINEKGQTVGDTTDALDIVRKHLADFAADPEMASKFSTETAFRNYFGYNDRSAAQKAVFDDFYKGYTADIAKQKANQDRYNTLSTMSNMDLMNISDVNDISLINQDPILAAKYQQAQNNKQMLEFVYGKDYNKTPTPQIDGLDGLPDNIQQEMAAANAELTTTKNEMDKLQDMIDGTYDKLAKQAEGTGATESYLRAKAGKINSELTDQYNDLVRKYNSQLGTATSLNSMAQAAKEEETAKRQERAQNLDMFNAMYGSFSDRNAVPVRDPNIGKTLEIKDAKGHTVGYNLWNTETQRYDIPTSSSGIGTYAGGRNGDVSKPSATTELDKLILASAKGSKLNNSTAVALGEALATPRTLESLVSAIDNYQSKFGPIKGRLNGLNEFDVDAQTIQAQINLIKQRVGKMLEGGVLRKEDEEKYKKILPTLQDTPAVALNKMNQLNSVLINGYNSTLEGLARGNIDVSRFNILPNKVFSYKTTEKIVKKTPAQIAIEKRLADNKKKLGLTTNTQTIVSNVPQFGIGQIGFGIGQF